MKRIIPCVKPVAHKSSYSKPTKTIVSNEFRFTNDLYGLSRDQKLFYEENGYIVIPKLVNLDCLERYKQRFQAICEGKVQVPGITIMKDISFTQERLSEKVVNKIQDFLFDDVLFEYCKQYQILKYVKCFCGPNIKAMQSMLINKPPDTGALTSRHPLHQDLFFFPFRPADKIVCSWTAIEKVNRENGCLSVIPGSHRKDLLEHGYPDWKGGVNKMYHGVLNLEEKDFSKRTHLEMDAGDTVFFHPLLIHGSGANRTDGFRKAISCHYAPANCYYINVEGTNQEHLVQELFDVAKKRGLPIDDLKDFCERKCRLVSGYLSALDS